MCSNVEMKMSIRLSESRRNISARDRIYFSNAKRRCIISKLSARTVENPKKCSASRSGESSSFVGERADDKGFIMRFFFCRFFTRRKRASWKFRKNSRCHRNRRGSLRLILRIDYYDYCSTISVSGRILRCTPMRRPVRVVFGWKIYSSTEEYITV